MDENNFNLENYDVAYFSGGCFWCSEADFEKQDGVIEVVSGYLGGTEENPTYREVASGETSHREGIKVYYDSSKISYDKLLDVYFRHIDPTDDGGSFVDRGFVYSSAIFTLNEDQKKLATNYIKNLEKSKKFDKPIVVDVIDYTTFYKAEEYHQDYYKKNPVRYKFYRGGSGRDDFIEENWRDEVIDFDVLAHFDKEKAVDSLTELQYHVTQDNGTERPFDNEYWDNKEDGIYVDIVSGEVLFSSLDKYESGTGWPSFTKPLDESNIVLSKDYKLILPRTEVRSKTADSHLGHVFNDGPKDKGGKRYCMNSAAMRFIPKDDLEKEGYSKYSYLFE